MKDEKDQKSPVVGNSTSKSTGPKKVRFVKDEKDEKKSPVVGKKVKFAKEEGRTDEWSDVSLEEVRQLQLRLYSFGRRAGARDVRGAPLVPCLASAPPRGEKEKEECGNEEKKNEELKKDREGDLACVRQLDRLLEGWVGDGEGEFYCEGGDGVSLDRLS